MRQKCPHCKEVYPEWDSEDRFHALQDVRTLLKSRHVNADCIFGVLSKSNDGCVDFNIGAIAVQFVRGFGVWSERRDVIQMTVELCKGDEADVIGHEYTLDELRRERRKNAQTACARCQLAHGCMVDTLPP